MRREKPFDMFLRFEELEHQTQLFVGFSDFRRFE